MLAMKRMQGSAYDAAGNPLVATSMFAALLDDGFAPSSLQSALWGTLAGGVEMPVLMIKQERRTRRPALRYCSVPGRMTPVS